jgi:hypothetical protein
VAWVADDAEGAERQVPEPRPPDEEGRGHRPERPRIGRDLSVITHNEQFARRNEPVIDASGFGRPGPAALGIEVRLSELYAVDVYRAVLDCHAVATDTDDPLDQRRSVALALPPGRGVEDDDVTPVVCADVGCQLVDEDALLGFERLLHGLLQDAVRLGNEGLEDEEEDECQDEGLDDLVEAAQRAAAHSSEASGSGEASHRPPRLASLDDRSQPVQGGPVEGDGVE